MPLKYRREEFINNNMTLCEPDCEYLGYNKETKNSKCKCGVKIEMEIFNLSIDSNILYQKFKNASNINIDIIKCYYLLSKKEYITYNIGSYILLFIILIIVVGALIFCFKGYYFLNRKINHVIIITNLDKKSTKSFNNNSLNELINPYMSYRTRKNF